MSKVQHYSDEKLLYKIKETKAKCNDYQRDLAYIPENSILGFTILNGLLRLATLKLEELQAEAQRRNLDIK